MTAKQALDLLMETKMEPFSETDWMAFAGCETADPKIGHTEDLERTIIVDGDRIIILDGEMTEHTFTLEHTRTSDPYKEDK